MMADRSTGWWGRPCGGREVLVLAIPLIVSFVAAYCLFDAMNVIFASALKGAGDTRFILITSLIVTPIPLLAAWLGIYCTIGGLMWCWSVATVCVSTAGLLYGGRFIQGHWRHMRVIEPDVLA
jgi:multidrug resistance protein, MATE family